MGFVCEKIDNARAQELLSLIPKWRVLSLSPVQVIDRGADVTFVCLGGKGELPPERGEPPTRYTLLWQGAPVFFEGYNKRHFTGNGVEVDITVVEMRVPNSLQNAVSAIRQAIEEAMACYWTALQERPATVSMHFPAAQFY